MSIGDTQIVQVGNVATEPELRFTQSGVAVINFRIASTPRRFNKDTNEYEDLEPLFLTVNVWREQAENVAETISKGMQVVVLGNLRQRSYETNEGVQKTSYEIEADHVAPSLRFATAVVTKVSGNSAAKQPGRAPGQAQGGGGFSNAPSGNWG